MSAGIATSHAPAPEASSPIAGSLRTKRFSALDGLRAFAIASVVWFHTSLQPHAEGIFARGLGVTLFFTISGFLITTILLREQAKTGTISLGNFYIRRALRIFPLYYAVLGLYVVLVELLESGTPRGAEFFSNLPYYLTFTANWFVAREEDGRVIFYFAWSLSMQEQFYLTWPAALRLARTRSGPVVLMALLLVTGEATRWALASGHLVQGSLGVRILSGIASSICLGSLLAFLLYREDGAWLADRVAGRAWSAPLAAGLVLLPALFEKAPMVLTSLAMLYLVMVCAVRPGVLTPLLENRLARHVGLVSYGVYLFHMLALHVVRRAFPGQGRFVTFSLTLALAVLVASISYRFFEQPFLELKGRFTSRPRSSEAQGHRRA